MQIRLTSNSEIQALEGQRHLVESMDEESKDTRVNCIA